MDKAEDEVVVSGTEVEKHGRDVAEEKPMSKRQLKMQKRREEWLTRKAERRKLQKEKRKEQHRRKLETGVDVGPTRKALKRNTMKNSRCKITIAVDLSFDDLMSEKDINKLSQQVQYCYSLNRRAPDPIQLHLTSLGAKTQQRLDHIGDYAGWDINISKESYAEVFGKDNIVYLTSESPNVLETLEPSKVYVIGGLVDHNHYKGHCFTVAQQNGICHARLPIDLYLQMNTRKVLAINHVFDILLRYTETGSWKDAFFGVIPRRKQVESCRSIDVNRCDDKASPEIELAETASLLQSVGNVFDNDR